MGPSGQNLYRPEIQSVYQLKLKLGDRPKLAYESEYKNGSKSYFVFGKS